MAAHDSNVEQAISMWRQLLGPDRVLALPAEGRDHVSTTLAHAQQPAGLVRVRSKDEVVDVVRIADQHGVALYPISRGKNWGYGDASPVGPGQFILDLSQMDRIVEVDAELAYAVVEPGVSQRQLHEYLERNEYPLWMSCTASSPDASVVGNLLERGFGATPYSDHAAHTCGMEVVLADGTVVETGLDRYPGAATGHAYHWGLGPHLDGIFTQSNFGVVVRAGIWLLPRPEGFAVFTLNLGRQDQIEELIDRLRTLRLAGTITAPVFIENAFRSLANRRRYPWEETGGATPLSRQMAQEMLSRNAGPGGSGAWQATGSVYGTRRAVRAALRDTRAGLRGLGRLSVVSPSRLSRAERWAGPLAKIGFAPARRLAEGARSAREGMGPLQGMPGHGGLEVSRWRLRREVEGPCEDPAAEGCGLYWTAPVCAAKGSEVARCVRLIEAQMLERGFEPLIRIAVADDRSVFVTTLLTFDRDDPTQSGRAGECHRELTVMLIEEGYPPYRGGVNTMDLLDPSGATYWEVVGRIRGALDPHGILAPGRYDPATATKIRTAGSEAA
jgi:4-cresol dehydrogenase (hydroxylating) flavoprotein subunit